MQGRTKVRRRVLACARCRKRKLSCDGKVPACTRCVDAGVPCVGFDSSTQREAPRSIADFLEMHIATLEGQRSPALKRPGAASAAFPSPADTHHESEGHGNPERGTYADALVNHVMEDVTPSFLGISKAKPILSCVVRGTQLPSNKKGMLGATDLNENHPRSIINPQPSTTSLEKFDRKTANNLFHNYLDNVITQYPIYHRNDVTFAFNSVYFPASSPGQDTPRNRYIVSLIMAISFFTAARAKQQEANAHAYSLVRHAMQWMPEVATNDIPGLQAILLLTQYIFLNPSMADVWLLTGLISQAVIDLGLHQELPHDSRISAYQRDMRRRLFWVAWEMEVAVCSIFSRPINLPTRRYDVAFPVEVDDICITEAGIDLSGRVSKVTSKRIWLFRQIEAEIISVLYQNDPLPKECASLELWMQRVEAAVLEWHTEVYQSAADNKDPLLSARWQEMRLYADIVYPYILLMLYRPSKRIPNPTDDHWVEAFYRAVQIAEGYLNQSEADFSNIKYVFHPCHHCFNASTIFVHVLARYKSVIAVKYKVEQVRSWMQVFSNFFSTIAERWPAASRCSEEYERLLDPARREYEEYMMSPNHVPPQTPTIGDHTTASTLYNYPATTEVDDTMSFWTAFNPITTVDMVDPLNAVSCDIPYDWNAEFNLNFNLGMESISDA